MPVILGIECDDSVTAQSSLRPLERVKGPLGSHLNRFVTVSFLVHATVTRHFHSRDKPFSDPTRAPDATLKAVLANASSTAASPLPTSSRAPPSPTRARRRPSPRPAASSPWTTPSFSGPAGGAAPRSVRNAM